MKKMVLFTLCIFFPLLVTTTRGDEKIALQEKKSTDFDSNFSMQEARLKGRVTDSQGNPVIGASVRIKGTLHGTITDPDGNFNLPIESNQSISLIVAYIGHQEVTILISDPLHFITIIIPEETN